MTAWGDGFDDDGWDQVNAVTDWDRCAPEEYIRVFPALLRHGAGLPPCLAAHFAARLLALRGEAARDADRRRTAWVRGRAMGLALWPARRRTAAQPGPGRVAAALTALEGLQARLARNGAAPFEARMAAELAFWIGIHPAYVWPEALVLHDHLTTVGWLGQAARARCSFMLGDVAAYLVSALAEDGTRRVTLLDPALAPYLGSPALRRRLLRVAQRRLGQAGFGIRFLAGMDRRLPGLLTAQAGS